MKKWYVLQKVSGVITLVIFLPVILATFIITLIARVIYEVAQVTWRIKI